MGKMKEIFTEMQEYLSHREDYIIDEFEENYTELYNKLKFNLCPNCLKKGLEHDGFNSVVCSNCYKSFDLMNIIDPVINRYIGVRYGQNTLITMINTKLGLNNVWQNNNKSYAIFNVDKSKVVTYYISNHKHSYPLGKYNDLPDKSIVSPRYMPDDELYEIIKFNPYVFITFLSKQNYESFINE